MILYTISEEQPTIQITIKDFGVYKTIYLKNKMKWNNTKIVVR